MKGDNTNRCMSIVLAALAGAVSGMSMGLVTGVLAGATGSSIQISNHSTNNTVVETVKIGALGGAILLGSLGFINETILAATGTKRLKIDPYSYSSSIIIASTLIGLVGHALRNNSSPAKEMDLKDTLLAFALGGLMLSWPFTFIAISLYSCICPNAMKEIEEVNDDSLRNNYNTF